MHMKKVALSLAVIAASGGYVWSLSAPTPAGTPLGSGLGLGLDVPQTNDVVLPVALPPAALPAPRDRSSAVVTAPPSANAVPPAPAPGPTRQALQPAAIPEPRPRPIYVPPPPGVPVTPTATRTATPVSYTDGVYTGPVVDAYWGEVQIQAIVQSGRLTGIRVLRYPSDRQRSLYISQQAFPLLRDEVVAAQSADVDIISGATLTSEAFIRSLGSALGKARL
jgi:uncharacterized protein with FMN-binding domain